MVDSTAERQPPPRKSDAAADFRGLWSPAPILADQTLPLVARLVLCEVIALSEKTGVCWARNDHFARHLGKSGRTIQRAFADLTKRGLIETEEPNGRDRLARPTPLLSALYRRDCPVRPDRNVSPDQTEVAPMKPTGNPRPKAIAKAHPPTPQEVEPTAGGGGDADAGEEADPEAVAVLVSFKVAASNALRWAKGYPASDLRQLVAEAKLKDFGPGWVIKQLQAGWRPKASAKAKTPRPVETPAEPAHLAESAVEHYQRHIWNHPHSPMSEQFREALSKAGIPWEERPEATSEEVATIIAQDPHMQALAEAA